MVLPSIAGQSSWGPKPGQGASTTTQTSQAGTEKSRVDKKSANSETASSSNNAASAAVTIEEKNQGSSASDTEQQGSSQPHDGLSTTEVSLGETSKTPAAPPATYTSPKKQAPYHQAGGDSHLPYTFRFGMPRPTTVALATRFPVFGQTPDSPAEAVRDTLESAATTRLPALKGQSVSLYV